MSALDPFALGGLQEPDAELIAAEREMRRLLDEGRDLDEAGEPLTQRWKKIGEFMAILNATVPTTLAGCLAKLRFLCDAENGMETGDREDDVLSLRQVLAFLESAEGVSAPDPVPALVAERMKIWHSNDSDRELGISDAERQKQSEIVCDQVNVLDNRIADIVAPSADGILAQFELLMELTEPTGWSDNRDRRLMEAIKAGLRKVLPDADELVLSLFRQWIAVCGEVDALAPQAEETDAGRNVHQRWNEIEDEIMASPPGGAVALAIKAYICIRQSHDGGGWSSHTAMLRLNEDDRDNFDHEAGVLRSAAALVPEIGELAASIVHEDAELIDADTEVAWVHELLTMKRPDDWPGEAEAKLIEAKLAKALDRIAQTEAKTERGEAIKARHAQR